MPDRPAPRSLDEQLTKERRDSRELDQIRRGGPVMDRDTAIDRLRRIADLPVDAFGSHDVAAARVVLDELAAAEAELAELRATRGRIGELEAELVELRDRFGRGPHLLTDRQGRQALCGGPGYCRACGDAEEGTP